MSITLKGAAAAFREIGLDSQNGYVNMLSNKFRVQDQQIMSMAEVEVTTAQVLALNAAPISMVAAPGAGKAIIFAGAMIFLDYAGTAYAGIATNEDLVFRYTNGSGAVVSTVETTGFLDATADAIRYAHPASTAAITPVANAALVLHLTTAEIITGTSPLRVRTFYHVVDTSWS